MNCDTKSTLAEKKLYVFDLDGTVYLGNTVFDFAVNFIKNLRKSGKDVLFFTNNASHTADFYIEKLTKMGFSPSRKEIMTSGDVTVEFLLRHRAGKSVYVVGTDELVRDFRARGIKIIGENEAQADIVVTSFDTSLTYDKLNAACRYVRNGAEYLSTHPDSNCPTENGFVPDSGAISAFVTASTGKMPTYFGKPYKETLDMITEVTGAAKEEICVFGDRMETDIAIGKRNGVTSVLLLSGVTTKSDVESADDADKPDFTFPSLREIGALMFGEK